MNDNGTKAPLPFQAPANTPLVGQLFTFLSVPYIKVSVPAFKCNCGGVETTIAIDDSVPATCPSCHRIWNVTLNPTTVPPTLNVILVPLAEQVPS